MDILQIGQSFFSDFQTVNGVPSNQFILPGPVGIDGANGDITGNVNTDPTDFNAPDTPATLQTLTLSNLNVVGTSEDRLVIQLNGTPDTVYVDGFGAVVGYDGTNLQAKWALGFDGDFTCRSLAIGNLSNPALVTAVGGANQFSVFNNGSIVRTAFNINAIANVGYAVGLTTPTGFSHFVTINDSLSLYHPDPNGLVGVYNDLNSNYAWRISANGIAQFSGVIADSGAPLIVSTDNVVVPNDGVGRDIWIDLPGGYTGPFAVNLPVQPPVGTTYTVITNSLGGANLAFVGTPTPVQSFKGGGYQSIQVNLLNSGAGGGSAVNTLLTFKFVNYGGVGDWYVWS